LSSILRTKGYTKTRLNRAPSRRFLMLFWRAVKDSEGVLGFCLPTFLTLGERGSVGALPCPDEDCPILLCFFEELLSSSPFKGPPTEILRFLDSRIGAAGIDQPVTSNNAIELDLRKKITVTDVYQIRTGLGPFTQSSVSSLHWSKTCSPPRLHKI